MSGMTSSISCPEDVRAAWHQHFSCLWTYNDDLGGKIHERRLEQPLALETRSTMP